MQPKNNEIHAINNADFALRATIRLLRFSFILFGDVRKKVWAGDCIYDCAKTIRILRERYGDYTINPKKISKGVYQALKESISSSAQFDNSYVRIVSILDGISTSLLVFDPDLTSKIRRTAEMIASGLSSQYPHPRHFDLLETHDGPCDLEHFAWPEVPDSPGRLPTQERAAISDSKKYDLLKELHGQIFGIEVCAGEVCAAMALRYPDLPQALDFDLARQTYEEGRHARLLLTAYEERGGHIQDFEPSLLVWQSVTSGISLTEMLCIEQFLGEGHSLGYDLQAIEEHNANGHGDLAEIHWSLHTDELVHISQGIEWLRFLAGTQAGEVIANLEPKFAVTPPEEKWFSEELRAFVGFTEEEIARQRTRSKGGAPLAHFVI